jgi:hypothetical protein
MRSRVVQAGALDVVGCILEASLANNGFAVGPSSSVSGMHSPKTMIAFTGVSTKFNTP